MARSFASASSQYLEIDVAVASGFPMTFASWAWLASSTFNNLQYWLTLHDKDVGDQGYRLGKNNSTNEIMAYSYAGTGDWAASTATPSADTWFHACAVFGTSTYRAAYLNGGNKGTQTDASSPTGMDRTSIGRAGDSTPGYYINGRVAEAAIWTAALSDAEVAILALGWPSNKVRPASLAGYWPLLRNDNDCFGDLNMTAYGSPTWADHPPKLKQFRRVPFYVVGAATATVARQMMHLARLRRA